MVWCTDFFPEGADVGAMICILWHAIVTFQMDRNLNPPSKKKRQPVKHEQSPHFSNNVRSGQVTLDLVEWISSLNPFPCHNSDQVTWSELGYTSGPPVVPFCRFFFGEGSLTKIDRVPCANLSSGGSSQTTIGTKGFTTAMVYLRNFVIHIGPT